MRAEASRTYAESLDIGDTVAVHCEVEDAEEGADGYTGFWLARVELKVSPRADSTATGGVITLRWLAYDTLALRCI
jgi:hypothetical protein